MSALAGIAAALVLGAAAITPVSAGPTDPEYSSELIGKAQPDECFDGIGQPYPAGPPCATGKPKVNQAYVWGMTKVGGDVWFGTGANTMCLTSGSSLGAVTPVVNDDYTCEYAESQAAKTHENLVPALGDIRAPQVWLYDSAAKTLVNKSAEINAGSKVDALRLRDTLGLRAAGNFDGVVLLAGPAVSSALNIFAFDAVSKRFLGSRTMIQYGNARTFLVAAGSLYLGVGIGPNGSKSGAVLRWTGNESRPFSFEKGLSQPDFSATNSSTPLKRSGMRTDCPVGSWSPTGS